MSRVPPFPNPRHWPAIVACVAMLVVPAVAQAAIDEYPIDRLLEGFDGVLGTWSDAVKAVADRLFWSLALISLTWTLCMMLFKRADFGELFAELVRFIIFTGLFWWLLDSGGGADGLIASILESGRLMGADGSAGDGRLRPSALLDSAFHVFNEVAAKSASDEWKDADKIVGLTLASVIVALVALAAVSMMLVIVMTWILAYAGLFLLGFGGARWTSGVAVNYYKHVLAVGMSYFVMLLLAGVGQTFLKEYSDAVADDITLPHLAILLTAAIVLVALLVRIPTLVSSMVLGSRFSGAGGASFSGHVMAMGGTAIATGVGHASSGAQALYSAYSAPSAAPPPAPMISMPTIHIPTPASAPGAASAPLATPVINVQHLDGHGMNPPQVTLSTQNMYPPPSGTAQSSVFGATPSAQEVARAQLQVAPGAGAGAGVANAAAPTSSTATDTAADRTTMMSPVLGAAPPTGEREATPRPSIDAGMLQRHPGAEPPLSATNLAASTASLPGSPGDDRPVSALDSDDATAEAVNAARRPAEMPASGFTSFASQPLSASALPPAERGSERGSDGAAGEGDGPDRSAGHGHGPHAASLTPPKGASSYRSAPSAATARSAGRASADAASPVPRAAGTPPPGATASPPGRDGQDGRDAGARGATGTSSATASHAAAGVDRPPPADPRSDPAAIAAGPARTAPRAAIHGRGGPGRWQRILRALRLRFGLGRSDDDAG